MTDKQIIIDGVDVTNCIHRATNKLCGDIDPYCRCYTGSCKDINNCYYKQLQAKEQECEKKQEVAQASINKLCMEKSALYNELDQLKTDCEHLAEKEGEARYYLEVANKFYQTLTEIKEIANNFYKTGFLRTDCGATLINNNTCINTLELILQKISECEGNDEN